MVHCLILNGDQHTEVLSEYGVNKGSVDIRDVSLRLGLPQARWVDVCFLSA